MRSYEDVAAYFSVTLCTGCDWNQGTIDHRKGSVTGDVLHWESRRMTRPGLRKFLLLIASMRILNYHRMNRAMQIYAANTWATRATQYLHVRFPHRYSQTDRATVRWLITQGHDVTEPAHRWAHRQETP